MLTDKHFLGKYIESLLDPTPDPTVQDRIRSHVRSRWPYEDGLVSELVLRLAETQASGSVSPHVHENHLQLYIRGQLDSDQVEMIESHMRGCRGCKDRLTDTARTITQRNYSGEEKRVEPRIRTEDIGILQRLAPLSLERSFVRIIDVSKSGLGLVTSAPLAAGSLVQVRMGRKIVLGEVRYSTPYGEDFHAGIELKDVAEPMNQKQE